MRIAFIVNNYPPRVGGVELHVRSLAAELSRTGHEVLVVTLGADPGWRSDSDVSVLTLPEHLRVGDVLGFPALGTRRHLTRLLKERRIDVVSVHTRFFPVSFLGLRAARAAHRPVVHTEHGSGHIANGSFLIRAASRCVDVTIGRWVLRHADRVLGVSENVVDFVQSLAGVKADVFYNAIDTAALGKPAPVDRPNHLVFVGRIVQGKGWELFLDTVAAMHEAGREMTGEVLGDGTQMELLHERIRELQLTDIVSVRGRVTQAEVRTALQGATLVNPTTLAEGFQTSLLEAIAESGRIVSFKVPGISTLKEQGAPVVITEAKTLRALIASTSALLDSPGKPAPVEFINQWSWSVRAKEFTMVCREAARSYR